MNFSPLPTKTVQPELAKVDRLTELSSIIAELLVAAALLWVFRSTEWGSRLVLVLAGLLIGAQIISIMTQGLQQRAWRYELWERELETLEGVVFKKRTLIPLSAVAFVETSQGPFEKMFGVLSLRVSTAAKEHKIPGLKPEVASNLRQVIISKAGISESA